MNKIRRKSVRVGIRQLTSIIKNRGDFELIQGSDKATTTDIKIINVSSGGLCIELKLGLKEGVSLDLRIPKIKNLDVTVVTCEVMRSVFREDPLFYKTVGKDKSYYEIGLKFKVPNTAYLKQLYDLAKTDQI